jgi:hypothetical protein
VDVAFIFLHHEGRTPTHGCAATRENAMARLAAAVSRAGSSEMILHWMHNHDEFLRWSIIRC